LLADLTNQIPRPQRQISLQHIIAILCHPHQVILDVVNWELPPKHVPADVWFPGRTRTPAAGASSDNLRFIGPATATPSCTQVHRPTGPTPASPHMIARIPVYSRSCPTQARFDQSAASLRQR
jgi:hypothetical protein